MSRLLPQVGAQALEVHLRLGVRWMWGRMSDDATEQEKLPIVQVQQVSKSSGAGKKK
jgi:metal-sulfur cluster biosynthetic enzyme